MRAEEMRLLYVAMTRAEHKLILFTAVRGGEDGAAAALADRAACPVSPWEAANAACMADWILPPVLARVRSRGRAEATTPPSEPVPAATTEPEKVTA